MTPTFHGRILLFGLSHRQSTLALRESLRCDDASLERLLCHLTGLGVEQLVLSTCERFEMYWVSSAARDCGAPWGAYSNVDARAGIARIAEFFEVPARALVEQAQIIDGDSAAEHLLRVAAGLESRIAGEPQILGQVRKSFLRAAAIGTAGAVLSALARAAIHTGKRVRTETRINAGARSSATIAVDCISGNPSTIRNKTILILGTGKLAHDVAVVLTNRRAGRLLVASSLSERAWELARRFGGHGLGFEELAMATSDCDGVIACSQSDGFILDCGTLEGTRQKDLAIIDLGVPRNVDPNVSKLPGVRLEHLDDLAIGEPVNLEVLDSAEAIVAEELDRFVTWRRGRRVAPWIRELVRRVPADQSVDRRDWKRSVHALITGLKRAAAA